MKEMMKVFKATYYDRFAGYTHGDYRTENFTTKESAKKFLLLLSKECSDCTITENIYYVDEDNRITIKEGEVETVYTKNDYEASMNFIEKLNNEIKDCKKEIEKIKTRRYKKEETRQAKIDQVNDEIARCHRALKIEIEKIAKMGLTK